MLFLCVKTQCRVKAAFLPCPDLSSTPPEKTLESSSQQNYWDYKVKPKLSNPK